MAKSLAKVETPSYGPAMMALVPKRRRFVEALFQDVEPGHGAPVRAAKLAGYACSTPEIASASAWRLMGDPQIKAAMVEMSVQLFGTKGPSAIAAFTAILNDPTHKDQAKMVLAYFDRVAPVETKQTIRVEHEQVDRTSQVIGDIAALRDMGASEAKLVELYGKPGLARYDALAKVQASEAAKIIDADFEEVETEEDIQW